MAPQNENMLAALTIAVVVPDMLTMVPMNMDRMNWAKKTILDTIATSVPKPRN